MSSSPARYQSAAQRDGVVDSSSQQLEMQHSAHTAGPPSSAATALPLTQSTSDQYDFDSDDEDDDDISSWHVAIVPAGLHSSSSPLSSPSKAGRQSSLTAFLSLLAVAFSAIKKNIVTHPTTHSHTHSLSHSSLTHSLLSLTAVCGLVLCVLCVGCCQVPGLVLQCLAVFLLVLYYSSASVAAAFQSVADLKEQSAAHLLPQLSTAPHSHTARCRCTALRHRH